MMVGWAPNANQAHLLNIAFINLTYHVNFFLHFIPIFKIEDIYM